MSQLLLLTDRNFEHEVLQSELPVLVDFWASWCPPCKMTEPVVAELAVEYEGKVRVGKLNVDRNPHTAHRYDLAGVPTFAIFLGGEIVQRRTGAQSRAQLVGLLEQALQSAVSPTADRVSISVVMPAYNEAERIGDVVNRARAFADEVIVVDDGSSDDTALVAESAKARVVSQAQSGYIAAIKSGFRAARGEIVVTMDADGEHQAEDIPRLIAPITEGKADLVLGRRARIARWSERFLNWLTRLRVPQVHDTGTGFRALRRELALKLELEGRCICGVSVLEPVALGARVSEVPIELVSVDKPRQVAWFHGLQAWYVLSWLFRRSG